MSDGHSTDLEPSDGDEEPMLLVSERLGEDGTTDAALEALLVDIRKNRGVDFTGYKRSSLRRRFLRRMKNAGADGDFEVYAHLLRTQPDELSALLDSIFIN